MLYNVFFFFFSLDLCLFYVLMHVRCRHRILYPIQLGPLFPNDAEILILKVGLAPN